MLKRKLALFCSCLLMLVMLFPGSMVMAKEQERAKPKVYQLQFVDPEGNPVPMYVPKISDKTGYPEKRRDKPCKVRVYAGLREMARAAA